jgi:hypothetical protein
MPDRYDTAGDRFADRGNFDFDRHALEKRRGLSAFRQYKTSATHMTHETRTARPAVVPY